MNLRITHIQTRRNGVVCWINFTFALHACTSGSRISRCRNDNLGVDACHLVQFSMNSEAKPTTEMQPEFRVVQSLQSLNLIQSNLEKMSQSQSHNSIQSEASGSTKEPGADIPRSLHTGRCWTTGWSTSILTGSALSLYGPDPWIGGLGVKSEV